MGKSGRNFFLVFLTFLALGVLGATAFGATTPASGPAAATPAAGDGGAAVAKTVYAQPARELSLPQALEVAMAGSPAMKSALLERDQAQLSWEQGRDAAGQIKSEDIMSLDTAKAKHVTQRQAELAEAAAGRNLKAAELKVRQQVEEAYHNALKAEDGLRLAGADLDRAKGQLALVRTQYAAGTKSRLDVLTAEVGVSQADAAVRQARRGREMAIMKLNQVIGLALDTPLKLTTRFHNVETGAPPGLEAAVQQALERRPDLLALVDARELAQISFDLAKAYYTPNVYVYRQAELDLRGADLTLEGKKADMEFEVRAAYAAMQDAAERVNILRKTVEQAREGLRVANLMYENGLATSQTLSDARVGLLSAETQAAQAQFDYSLARSRFGVATAEGVR